MKTMTKKTSKPLWQGPEVDGVTYSLLSRFLVCRERFRLYAIEGLRPAKEFSQRVEYGNMWHVCEEVLAGSANPIVKNPVAIPPWVDALQKYCQQLVKQYPTQGEQIAHWYNVCKAQFPVYVEYWAKHPDVLKRTPLLQEQVFCVAYTLPSGRCVKLRGKWDSVDLIGKEGTFLQENKTKGDINEESLKRQLSFDLQTMLYLVALEESGNPGPIAGVRYNVVRRPLSGGRHSIRPHQATSKKPAETDAEFYARLAGLIAGEPEYFFMRWKCVVTPGDITKFKRQCLDPLLQELCLWYDWVAQGNPWELQEAGGVHWRFPYGVYSPLTEGRESDIDEYLQTGGMVGLHKVDSLFGELT